jgi:protein gp37
VLPVRFDRRRRILCERVETVPESTQPLRWSAGADARALVRRCTSRYEAIPERNLAPVGEDVRVSDNSAIEWTEATWNPVTGCHKVSPGCAHCYAETFAERWRGIPGHHYEQGFDLRLWPERLEQPLRWRRPRRIFVNSMSDLFHEDIPEHYVRQIFEVMTAAHWHTFQILTKRHERLAELGAELDWPPNVWMGVSIENRRFVHRADALRGVQAALRFISAEPLLGPLEGLDLDGIDWLIAGGESGPHHRRLDLDWVRDLRDRCLDEDVAFFFKQVGGRTPKAGGRMLDRREWNEYPLVQPPVLT